MLPRPVHICWDADRKKEGIKPFECDESLSIGNASFESVYKGFLEHILNLRSTKRNGGPRKPAAAIMQRIEIPGAKQIEIEEISFTQEVDEERGVSGLLLKKAKNLMQHLRRISTHLKEIKDSGLGQFDTQKCCVNSAAYTTRAERSRTSMQGNIIGNSTASWKIAMKPRKSVNKPASKTPGTSPCTKRQNFPSIFKRINTEKRMCPEISRKALPEDLFRPFMIPSRGKAKISRESLLRSASASLSKFTSVQKIVRRKVMKKKKDPVVERHATQLALANKIYGRPGAFMTEVEDVSNKRSNGYVPMTAQTSPAGSPAVKVRMDKLKQIFIRNHN